MSDWQVPLSDVRLPAAGIEAVEETLRGGWLSSGPQVAEFEAAFGELIGVEHAVACASGSAALELSLRAAGVEPGDEVLMPALNFVAAANITRRLGARVALADITSEDDLNVAPEAVTGALTSKTRAVVLLHYGGYPADPRIADELRERSVALVEDCAHAPGAARGDRRCGSWGTAGCFSFYANKHISLGEGGMLTTRDGEVAERARRLRSQGVTRPTWQRHQSGDAGYDITEAGYNFRLDEPRAALALALLPGLDTDLSARASALAHYRARLDGSPAAMPFADRPADERAAGHLAVSLLPPSCDRVQVAKALAEAGIQSSVHYPPIHTLAAHRSTEFELPQTDAISARLLSLPLFGHISEEQVDYVCDSLLAAIAP